MNVNLNEVAAVLVQISKIEAVPNTAHMHYATFAQQPNIRIPVVIPPAATTNGGVKLIINRLAALPVDLVTELKLDVVPASELGPEISFLLVDLDVLHRRGYASPGHHNELTGRVIDWGDTLNLEWSK